MLRALYSSATGMKAQEMMIDNTANNLANVNTPRSGNRGTDRLSA
jgi:flagellar basal-body rod protein FlgG